MKYLFLILFIQVSVYSSEISTDIKNIKMGDIFPCEVSADILKIKEINGYISDQLYFFENEGQFFCVGLKPIEKNVLKIDQLVNEININFKIENAEVLDVKELQVINQTVDSMSGKMLIVSIILVLIGVLVLIYFKRKNKKYKNSESRKIKENLLSSIKHASKREEYEKILTEIKNNHPELRSKFKKIDDVMKLIQYKKDWTVEEYNEVTKRFKEINIDV